LDQNCFGSQGFCAEQFASAIFWLIIFRKRKKGIKEFSFENNNRPGESLQYLRSFEVISDSLSAAKNQITSFSSTIL